MCGGLQRFEGDRVNSKTLFGCLPSPTHLTQSCFVILIFVLDVYPRDKFQMDAQDHQLPPPPPLYMPLFWWNRVCRHCFLRLFKRFLSALFRNYMCSYHWWCQVYQVLKWHIETTCSTKVCLSLMNTGGVRFIEYWTFVFNEHLKFSPLYRQQIRQHNSWCDGWQHRCDAESLGHGRAGGLRQITPSVLSWSCKLTGQLWRGGTKRDWLINNWLDV